MFKIIVRLFSLVLFVWTALLHGDESRLSGPVSGFIFDRYSHAIRPMLGVPGSSYLGKGVVLNLEAAGIAPDGTAALAVKEGELRLLRNLKSFNPVSVGVEGAISQADRFAWNRDASAAAVYSSASRQVQVLRNLTETVRVQDTLDLSSLPGRVSTLALDSSGERLLVGVESEQGGGVYLMASGSPARLVAAARNPVAVSLARQDRDVFIVDRDRQQLWQIQDFEAAPTPLLLADEGSGLAAPVGVQVSKDGQRLFAANSGSNTLLVFDLNARAVTSRIELDFTPTVLSPFGERSLLLLNSGGDGSEPFFVLDTNESPTVYFVPAGREE